MIQHPWDGTGFITPVLRRLPVPQGMVFGLFVCLFLRVYDPDHGCTLSQWQRVSVPCVFSNCSAGSLFCLTQRGIFCLVFSGSLLLKWRESSRLVGDLGSRWLLWLHLLLPGTVARFWGAVCVCLWFLTAHWILDLRSAFSLGFLLLNFTLRLDFPLVNSFHAQACLFTVS